MTCVEIVRALFVIVKTKTKNVNKTLKEWRLSFKETGNIGLLLAPKRRPLLMGKKSHLFPILMRYFKRIWIVIYMYFSTWWKKMFFWVCLFPTILKTNRWASKNSEFVQNHQNSTNVSDNSFDKSLVLILKYTVCKFYDCRTIV